MVAAVGVLGLLLGLGCGANGGGWRARDLSMHTVDWKRVDGQRLGDVQATPSIAASGVDLLLCRWKVGPPIRIVWPDDASADELQAFEQARAAWSGLVDGLDLVTSTDADAEIRLSFVDDDDPAAPSGTADTVTDCVVDAGAHALANPADLGRIVAASIVMRRENVSWTGDTSPMSDEEFLGAVLHELGHALGLAGHIDSRRSVMSMERSAVRGAARRLQKGDPFREPTLEALYTVPLGTSVGRVGFRTALRPSLRLLAVAAAASDWRGPFGRAGGGTAHVFWQTPEGAHPGVFTFEWTSGVRGKRSLDWRLSLAARSALAQTADGSPTAP